MKRDLALLIIFGRAETGKQLSELVERIEDPLVIALEGGWGTGKSYFLKRWVGAHALENDGKALTVYFDAFAHDFMDDPLIALTGVIAERFSDNELKPNVIKQLKKLTFKLAKPVLRIGLAAVTAGLTEVTGAIADEAIKAGSISLEEKADAFWEKEDGKREAMRQFRETLLALTREEDGVNTQKLVVVVDELDRCRPDYALSMLEVIKHFFDVPNVHFILGVNLYELQNIVRTRYGSHMDARLYLQKFLSVSLKLPKSPAHRSSSFTLDYFEKKAKKIRLPKNLFDSLLPKIEHLLNKKEISFRDMNRLLSLAVLVGPHTNWGSLGFRHLATDSLLLKVFFSESYEKLLASSLTLNEAISCLCVETTGLNVRHKSRIDDMNKITKELWTILLDFQSIDSDDHWSDYPLQHFSPYDVDEIFGEFHDLLLSNLETFKLESK